VTVESPEYSCCRCRRCRQQASQFASACYGSSDSRAARVVHRVAVMLLDDTVSVAGSLTVAFAFAVEAANAIVRACAFD